MSISEIRLSAHRVSVAACHVGKSAEFLENGAYVLVGGGTVWSDLKGPLVTGDHLLPTASRSQGTSVMLLAVSTLFGRSFMLG